MENLIENLEFFQWAQKVIKKIIRLEYKLSIWLVDFQT
jgi:hypothetical protein